MVDLHLQACQHVDLQGTLFHGILWEGKVVRNCVQIAKLEWLYFEGIWKVCVGGSSGGETQSENRAQCARNARAPPKNTNKTKPKVPVLLADSPCRGLVEARCHKVGLHTLTYLQKLPKQSVHTTLIPTAPSGQVGGKDILGGLTHALHVIVDHGSSL